MTVGVDRRVVVCLDADVLIYAARPGHDLGTRVRRVLEAVERFKCCGSTMLLPEVLIKPSADDVPRERDELKKYIASMELWPTTETVGELAVWLGASYGLDPMDAVHLATAVDGGADVFLTNNSRDFDAARIGELDVIYPRELDFV